MIKPVVDLDNMDNSAVGNSGGSPASHMTEKMSHQKEEPLFPPENEDYLLCTNAALPEEAENHSPTVVLCEATCNVKMSANMATKLSQMRVSRESLSDSIENSCEDMRNEFHEEPLLDPNNQTNTTGKGVPQKPMLRQVYPCLSCLPFENNIVFCFVLSVWDNIVGPQTVNVWKRKSFPTQKTFDDLLEKEVEVGEDLMNVRRASIQTLLGMEIHHNTPPSVEGSWPGRRSGSRAGARRYSSTSNDSEVYSSTEHERKFSGKEVAHLLSSTRRISSPRLNDDSRPPSSVEAFCEDIGNDILMQSFTALKEKPKNLEMKDLSSRSGSSPSEGILPEPEEDHSSLHNNSVKNTYDSEGESDEQGKKSFLYQF